VVRRVAVHEDHRRPFDGVAAFDPAEAADLEPPLVIERGREVLREADVCPPGSEGVVIGCDEIAMGTDWLDELNGPDGERETYGDTAWMTIRDGSGAMDRAFLTPVYADSPVLAGAENLAYPLADHNELRLREDIVATYRSFIEEAIARRAEVVDGRTPADPTPTPSPDEAEVTGEDGHGTADGADGAASGDPAAGSAPTDPSSLGPTLPATGPSPAGGLLQLGGLALLATALTVHRSRPSRSRVVR
jgi:hypothetical protein